MQTDSVENRKHASLLAEPINAQKTGGDDKMEESAKVNGVKGETRTPFGESVRTNETNNKPESPPIQVNNDKKTDMTVGQSDDNESKFQKMTDKDEKKPQQYQQRTTYTTCRRNMSPHAPALSGWQSHPSSPGWPQFGITTRAPPQRYTSPHQPTAHTFGAQTTYNPARNMPPPSPSAGSSGSGSQQSIGEQLSKTNLYIRRLPPNTTDQDLQNMCLPYGKIVSVKAILDKSTNKCKGYGFVDFDSHGAAQKAVQALQQQGIEAQMAKQQEQDPTNLYLSNLPIHMDEKDLESLLSPYGQVISTRILRDCQTNMSRGVGFARMESKEKCEHIITKFNGNYLPGQLEPLLCKFADGGVKKRNQYNKQQQEMRQWQRDGETAVALYDQSPLPQNGYQFHSSIQSNRVVHPSQIMPATSYAMPTSPVNSYPVHSNSGGGWPLHAQYVMQSHGVMSPSIMTSQVDPGMTMHTNMMPQLTNQMNQLQLSGGSPVYGMQPSNHYQMAPQYQQHIIQTVPLEDHSAQQNVSGAASASSTTAGSTASVDEQQSQAQQQYYTTHQTK
uniref:RNA-binding motif, single-stranded-interacting protein 3-like isoform X2 n=1 Tax=Saccoglossus kowalevskii TaxID=10224 RepID=A0ABM0MH27_SACKO|nr:PREDICTED: RNA-binding motif, single-stranded-interacting protein 3-like isoform X2 [Saccoglossus kowalevskii]